MGILRKSVDLAIERFSSSIWGYFNLWSYFDNKLKHRIGNRKTHKLNSCLEFYENIYSGNIKHGDKIILNSFFVSEWAPRAAGGLARMVYGGKLKTQDYNALTTSFKPNSATVKSNGLIPPFGSVRFPLKNKKDIILSAVTACEYHIDMGIVLAVNESIYSEFLSKQIKNNSVEATIEGYVDLFNSPESLPSLQINDLVSSNAISLPSIVLRVVSPIQIKFRSHSSHPRFNAWFLRRTEYSHPRIIGLEFNYENGGIKNLKKNHGDLVEYNYSNWTIFENDPDEILRVREKMTQEIFGLSIEGFPILNKKETYEMLSQFDLKIDKRDYGIVSIEQLTEFDGRKSLVHPLISINIDPRKNPTKSIQLLKEIINIENEQEGSAD